MRYTGYVVTYSGGLLKVNRENYFLNGISREDPDRSDVYDISKDFARRNIYAVSSGVKCDEDGDEFSLIAIELLKNYATGDFTKDNLAYFSMLNSAVNGQTLKKNGEHFEVDTSVLYIENDVAKVYNFGDMPVFYFTKGKMEKLSGNSPKTIEIEKSIYENKWKIYTQVIEKTNIPYIGFTGNDFETVPYESKKIKLRKKAFFVMCSKSVCDLLGEETIEKILADRRIKSKKKAIQIVDMAIEKNPEGNYTVQVIKVNRGIPATHSDVKSLGIWLALVLLCVPLYFSGSYIVDAVNRFVENTKTFIETYITKEAEPDSDLVWIPRDTEEKTEEVFEESEENDEQSDITESTQPLETAPQSSNTPKPQKPVARSQKPAEQKPAVQEQKTEAPAEPKQEIELPGTTTPPETSQEVELPIDFN